MAIRLSGVLLCCLVCSSFCYADDSWTTNLYFENDLFGDTDQQYTNGTRLSWISPDLSSYLDDPSLPEWLTRVNKRLKLLHSDQRGLQRNLVISLGQVIYTPADKYATELIEDDRPYAGYLYLTFGYHMRSTNQLDSVELSLGVVGPASGAKQVQDAVHDWRGIDKFQGWDNQLKNEPALNLVYERKQKYGLPDLMAHLEQDFIAHGGISLGNVATYLNAGGEYRIGWQLPDDFGTSSLRPGGDTSAPGGSDPRVTRSGFSGLHLFFSLDSRLVARDIFLDGNTYRDSHSVDKRALVADLAVGVSTTFHRWKVSYAYVTRTREYDEQKRVHQYGSLSFSYTW